MEWLQVSIGAICGRNATSTGIAPFFMTHRWNQEVFCFEDMSGEVRDSPVSRADRVLRKLQEVREFAQASIAAAQDVQESGANQKRT